ncbi:MAG TPA: ABC transporter permease [Candidatus Saccharimonadales bacterium]|nr:ABC transporter permease [Candidatus Saccharimonadales bacterium]
MKKSWYIIWTFTRLNTRRFFRDRLAIFFSILFPLIFLFVFGGIFGKDSDVSFNVAVINQSNTKFAQKFEGELGKQKVFKIDNEINSIDEANEKLKRSQIDGAIILPKNFGEVKDGKPYPSGKAKVIYTQNNQQAGQTLASLLDAQFKGINAQYIQNETPLTVEAEQTSQKGLKQFDYTFAGLLGFSILGIGIFGPINVFPELKKQGILRRLHTTPLKVSEYFVSTVLTQVLLGMISIGIMFGVAIGVFDLHIVGNPIELTLFLVLSIITILGIGLALGGWAKNERQVAPLANIIVFPMMFLSGTFFPRFLMPEWLQSISDFIPLAPAIDGIRLIATEGKGLIDLLPQIGILGAWLVVVYLIAFRVFRWE